MEIKIQNLEIPENCNLILGQSHFIKTVEDLYEILIQTIPDGKFGIGFCESSGPCLVRKDGNEISLVDKAANLALELATGHSFIILLKDVFPISVLNRIKQVSEVCNIFCATANKLQVVTAETEQGKGILGVIDGGKSKGIENEEQTKERKEFLRKIGYKR